MTAYIVTELAGPKVAGRRVSPGETIDLTVRIDGYAAAPEQRRRHPLPRMPLAGKRSVIDEA